MVAAASARLTDRWSRLRASLPAAAVRPWQPLHRVADAHRPGWRAAVAGVLQSADVDMKALEAAARAGDALGATRVLLAAVDRMLPSLRHAARRCAADTLVAGAHAAARRTVGPRFAAAGDDLDVEFSFAFDVTNPLARQWAEDRSAQLVTQVGDETRLAIRRAVGRAFSEGLPPAVLARRIRPLIGLTDRHAAAVANLVDAMLANPGGLVRAGGMRIRVPDDPDAIADRIDRAVERYSQRLLNYRAEMIARTETITASSEGQRQLWLQAVERGVLTGHEQRVWIVTDDDRLCPQCEAMDGQTVGLDEDFEGPDGEAVSGPALHPHCRCSQGLVASLAAIEASELQAAEFNPDQPRDERGRWSPSGGIGAGAGVVKARTNVAAAMVASGASRRRFLFNPTTNALAFGIDQAEQTRQMDVWADTGTRPDDALATFESSHAEALKLALPDSTPADYDSFNVRGALVSKGDDLEVVVNWLPFDANDDAVESDAAHALAERLKAAGFGADTRLTLKGGFPEWGFAERRTLGDAWSDLFPTSRAAAFNPDQPRDDHGRWTPGLTGNAPATGRDDVRAAFDFESQVSQFPDRGKPGIGYTKGDVDPDPQTGAPQHVNALVYRDDAGKMRGVLYHYPTDIKVRMGGGGRFGGMTAIIERAGNVNVLVDPAARRQGIATKLLEEAGKRWRIDLGQQDYTEEGRKFTRAFVRARTQAERRDAYREDQLRDDRGRWTDDDGGGGGYSEPGESSGSTWAHIVAPGQTFDFKNLVPKEQDSLFLFNPKSGALAVGDGDYHAAVLERAYGSTHDANRVYDKFSLHGYAGRGVIYVSSVFADDPSKASERFAARLIALGVPTTTRVQFRRSGAPPEWSDDNERTIADGWPDLVKRRAAMGHDAFVAAEAARWAYSPDQPRDERGQWTDEGGVSKPAGFSPDVRWVPSGDRAFDVVKAGRTVGRVKAVGVGRETSWRAVTPGGDEKQFNSQIGAEAYLVDIDARTSAVDIDEAFHGTAAKFVESIVRDGILASKSGLVHPGYSQPGHVYMTVAESAARLWAQHAARRAVTSPEDFPPRFAVVKIQPPDDAAIAPDKNFFGKGVQDAYSFKGDIPPEWIVGVSIGTRTADGMEWSEFKKPADLLPRAAAGGATYYVVVALDDEERRDAYSPDQPRVPAGSPEGGQFTSDGGGSAASSTSSDRTTGVDDSDLVDDDDVAGDKYFEADGASNLAELTSTGYTVLPVHDVPDEIIKALGADGNGGVPDMPAAAKAGSAKALAELEAKYPGLHDYVKHNVEFFSAAYNQNAGATTIHSPHGVQIAINAAQDIDGLLKDENAKWSVAQQRAAGKPRDEALTEAYRTVMHHEIGHVLDGAYGGMLSQFAIAAVVSRFESPQDALKWIQENVSGYAASAPEEFVGELFAKAMAGETLDPEFRFIDQAARDMPKRGRLPRSRAATDVPPEWREWVERKATDWIRIGEPPRPDDADDDGERAAEFDPDQPRDERGRWTKGGGGSSAGTARTHPRDPWKEKAFDFWEKGGRVFFHGTSSAAIDSIKKHGLIPRGGAPKGQSRGADAAWPPMLEYQVGDRAASVYLVAQDDYDRGEREAFDYARMASALYPGSKPVVLAIRLPKRDVDRTVPDEMSGSALAVRLKSPKGIPPSWIRVLKKPHLESGIRREPPTYRELVATDGDAYVVFAVLVCHPESSDPAAVRTAEWDESLHPRDDRGRWTDTGGANAANPMAGEPAGVHTSAAAKRVASYLERETGLKFKIHGSLATEGATSSNDMDLAVVDPTAGMSDEEREAHDAAEADAANREADEIYARFQRGEISEADAMRQIYGHPDDKHPLEQALERIGFRHERDAAWLGIVASRFVNPQTNHAIEIWMPHPNPHFYGLEWDESLHPRDERGRFVDKGGESSGGDAAKPPAVRPHAPRLANLTKKTGLEVVMAIGADGTPLPYPAESPSDFSIDAGRAVLNEPVFSGRVHGIDDATRAEARENGIVFGFDDQAYVPEAWLTDGAHVVHTHPNGTPFSVEDVDLLISRSLGAISVVGADGEWYEMSRAEHGPTDEYSRMVDRVEKLNDLSRLFDRVDDEWQAKAAAAIWTAHGKPAKADGTDVVFSNGERLSGASAASRTTDRLFDGDRSRALKAAQAALSINPDRDAVLRDWAKQHGFTYRSYLSPGASASSATAGLARAAAEAPEGFVLLDDRSTAIPYGETVRRQLRTAEWDESQHPRDERGRFTSVDGASVGAPRVHEPKPGFKLDSARLATREGAAREFQRAIREQYPDGLVVYHETTLDELPSLMKGATDGLFGAVGRPSGFITSPDKAIVEVRLTPAQARTVVPDVIYADMTGRGDPDDMGWATLLREHGGVFGAYVSVNDAIRPSQMRATVLRGGDPKTYYAGPKGFRDAEWDEAKHPRDEKGQFTEVGITSARPGSEPREVFAKMRTFADKLSHLGGVKGASVQPGVGAWEGGSEPTWVVAYQGNGEATKLLAETAKQYDQDAVLMVRPAGADGTPSVSTEFTFDRGVGAPTREAIHKVLAAEGMGGWTWFKRNGHTVLRLVAVPQWGGDPAKHGAAAKAISARLARVGLTHTASDRAVSVSVLERESYDKVLRAAVDADDAWSELERSIRDDADDSDLPELPELPDSGDAVQAVIYPVRPGAARNEKVETTDKRREEAQR